MIGDCCFAASATVPRRIDSKSAYICLLRKDWSGLLDERSNGGQVLTSKTRQFFSNEPAEQ